MAELDLPKHYNRNFWSLAFDFCFFGVGMAFIGTSTVIPSFLKILGASSTIIGLMSSLQSASWLLPQLFAARYLADKPYKKPYILWPAAVGRSLILVLALVIWITGARHAAIIISLTALVIIGFWAGDGLASVAWFDFLSKVIPPRRRGRLTGMGQVLSGGLGFLAGFVVEWMLSDRGPAYPNNYAGLFSIGFGMLVLSFLSVSMGIEKRGVSAKHTPSWREFLPQLWHVLRHDHVFRRYTFARQLQGLSGLATPFYMTFAIDRLGLPEQVAGRYTSIGVLGSILAAMLFAWINERYGSKRVLFISLGLSISVPACALLIPRLITQPDQLAWAYGLVFFLFNAQMSSMMPGWMNYLLELAPEAERPAYVGLTNTLNGVTTLFAALGGVILRWSGDNYALLFGITIAGLILSCPLPFGLPEPRREQAIP